MNGPQPEAIIEIHMAEGSGSAEAGELGVWKLVEQIRVGTTLDSKHRDAQDEGRHPSYTKAARIT